MRNIRFPSFGETWLPLRQMFQGSGDPMKVLTRICLVSLVVIGLLAGPLNAGHGHTEKMATGEDFGYLVMVDASARRRTLSDSPSAAWTCKAS